MTRISLYVFLLASVSFPVVFSEYNYFEHYFSKYHHHHKSSSTTPSSSTTSSTTETTTDEAIKFLDPDDITSEEDSSFEESDETRFVANTTPMHNGRFNNDPAEYRFVARVGTIVGSLILVVIILGCIVCCCPNCCRGTQRRGFVMGERGTEVLPPPVITPVPQQPPIIQHLPPEYIQEPIQQFPPQYQQPVFPATQYGPMQQPGYQYSPMQAQPAYSPVQPQTHYSPVHSGYQNPSQLQFYNPPEAPPPYEASAPK